MKWTDIDVVEEECHFTKRLAEHTASEKWEKRDATTKNSTVLGTRFRSGHEPDLLAGLDLAVDDDD